VPEIDAKPAFTKLFGGAAIYAITPVSEEVARIKAERLGHTPISVWDLPKELRDILTKSERPQISNHIDADNDYEHDFPA
jgi:hypothetical protein